MMGWTALPLHNKWTLAMVTRAAKVYGDTNVVFFVPELRLQNLHWEAFEAKLGEGGSPDDEDRDADIFFDRAFGEHEMDSRVTCHETDKIVLEYNLRCLERLIKLVPRIKLVFWDCFFRDHVVEFREGVDEEGRTVGLYRDLYRRLAGRYSDNVIDIDAYMTDEIRNNVRYNEKYRGPNKIVTLGSGKTGPGLWRDDCAHPNELGFRFIHTVISDFFRRARADPEAKMPTEHTSQMPSAGDFARDWMDEKRAQNPVASMRQSMIAHMWKMHLEKQAQEEKDKLAQIENGGQEQEDNGGQEQGDTGGQEQDDNMHDDHTDPVD
eukprot:gnl/TRDRNA2_/TRDRNA2_170993_c1_seq2.p1 gnl/TRDRNA2_/TRDRNA2_170993_c1~~gnl/TRDRNA2_/TRDRNA2_170993_c1_seq2.p1  ORF type:complete len:322 (-),score=48.75 gnl/TRDRNA2_/TRDRNA2_170993_c1_seq2:170-1135(-)